MSFLAGRSPIGGSAAGGKLRRRRKFSGALAVIFEGNCTVLSCSRYDCTDLQALNRGPGRNARDARWGNLLATLAVPTGRELILLAVPAC